MNSPAQSNPWWPPSLQLWVTVGGFSSIQLSKNTLSSQEVYGFFKPWEFSCVNINEDLWVYWLEFIRIRFFFFWACQSVCIRALLSVLGCSVPVFVLFCCFFNGLFVFVFWNDNQPTCLLFLCGIFNALHSVFVNVFVIFYADDPVMFCQVSSTENIFNFVCSSRHRVQHFTAAEFPNFGQ